MVWFKVDDTLAFHAKTVAAGNSAMGLWVRAGAWCSATLTDGHVPDHMISALGKLSEAKSLVRAGLWERTEGGYVFHEWEARNPPRDKVEQKRQETRDRVAAWRAKQAGNAVSNDVTNEDREPNGNTVTNDVTDEYVTEGVTPPPTRPDPTRPDPVVKKTRNASRFAEFWDAYPVKRDKKKAQEAYDRLVARGVDQDRIINGAAVYAEYVKRPNAPAAKYPQGWLSGERWEDVIDIEPEEPTLPFTPPPPPGDMPEYLFSKWNRAHAEANRRHIAGPSDWRELEMAS